MAPIKKRMQNILSVGIKEGNQEYTGSLKRIAEVTKEAFPDLEDAALEPAQ
jgi:hypothetical protein